MHITTPNPRVGSVIVSPDGRLLGQGHTQAAGQAHAEIMALRQAQQTHDVRGATAYVTLEPCAHQGRTGPCCDALIQAGIARAVVSVIDPNPLVAGQGIARMQAAGVKVELGLLGDQAQDLNLGFFKRMTQGTPWMRLKVAQSLDGHTALTNGVSQWLTGALARADGHAWRARACAILTGMGTVEAGRMAIEDFGGKVHGFPIELTEELAASRNIHVDRAGFEREMEGHAKISGSAAFSSNVFNIGPIQELKDFVAPTDFQQGQSYRIIFVHVPAAWMSMFLYVMVAVWSALGLGLKAKPSFMMAQAIAPTGAMFTFLALLTGAFWGKPTWGAWWVWDARLTSELILLFQYLGFILLHQAETLSHRGLALISLLCLAAMALPLAQSPSSPLPRHDSILPSIAAFTAAVRSPEPDSSLPSAR